MTKLFRHPLRDYHWVAHRPEHGWFVFPAREGGWRDRRPARGDDLESLQPVPLWLSFNTGLLEDRQRHSLPQAA